MAAGEPYLSTDGDTYLQSILESDPILRRYLPGGASSVRPAEGTAIKPIARFWEQSPGKTIPRQDGRNGRVVSTPVYIVAALDRQAAGEYDKEFGNIGGQFEPPRPYLTLAVKRIYTLLHARRESSGGFHWTLECFSPYDHVEEPVQGWNDVLKGWWVRGTVT